MEWDSIDEKGDGTHSGGDVFTFFDNNGPA